MNDDGMGALAGSPGFSSGLLPFVVLVASGVAWGALYVCAKIATTAGVHPIGLALWEGLGAGTVLYAASLASRRTTTWRIGHLKYYAVMGLLGLTIPAVAFFAVAQHLPVGVTTLLFSLVPIMTYGVALLARAERFAWRRVFGLIAGLAGVLLILLPEASLPEPQMAVWVMLGFAAASLYAIQNVYTVQAMPPGVDALAIAKGTLLMGGLLLVPAVAVTDSLYLPTLPLGPADWSTLGIVLLSAAATLLFFWLLRVAGAVYGSQTAYTTMFAGVAWGFLLFDERLSWWVWAAIALMSAGIALVGGKRREMPPL